MINIISTIGMLTSIYLSVNEIFNPGYCPRILNIPACFIVLVLFILTILFNYKSMDKAYYIVTTIGLLMGIYFSYLNIFSDKVCPVIFKVPLCYVSVLTFSLLIYLKKKKK